MQFLHGHSSLSPFPIFSLFCPHSPNSPLPDSAGSNLRPQASSVHSQHKLTTSGSGQAMFSGTVTLATAGKCAMPVEHACCRCRAWLGLGPETITIIRHNSKGASADFLPSDDQTTHYDPMSEARIRNFSSWQKQSRGGQSQTVAHVCICGVGADEEHNPKWHWNGEAGGHFRCAPQGKGKFGQCSLWVELWMRLNGRIPIPTPSPGCPPILVPPSFPPYSQNRPYASWIWLVQGQLGARARGPMLLPPLAQEL